MRVLRLDIEAYCVEGHGANLGYSMFLLVVRKGGLNAVFDSQAENFLNQKAKVQNPYKFNRN